MKKINILWILLIGFAAGTPESKAFSPNSLPSSESARLRIACPAAAVRPADSLGTGWYKGVKVILHKVTPKETFYSIARHYNVHPKYLIQFNSHIKNGLKIGDTIRIAADSMNTFGNLVLVPENDPPARENPAPSVEEPPVSTLTEHVVAPRETLFAIARKYGLTVAEVRKLNNITDSHIEVGQRLIVSASGPIATDPDKLAAASGDQPDGSAGTPETAAPGSAAPGGNAPAGNTPAEAGTGGPVTDKPAPILGTPDRMAGDSRTKKKNDLPTLVREIRESGVAAWINNANLNQAKSIALHKSAPPGTIIKVTNPANKRSVMVKVVGSFPDNAETDNALIVISQAASRLLGVQDNRFRVNLSYAVQE